MDNDYPGTSYNSGDVEVGGSFYVDYTLTVEGIVNADSLSIANDMDVGNLFEEMSLDGNQSDFTMDGGLELWSNFSPGMTELRGAAHSWLHSGIDLGDLTYTSTDTPALNLSQNTDGTYFYPTIYHTGYDANTTWVWQQNGLAALSNSSLLIPQMQLTEDGNLTLADSSGSDTLQIISDTGNINLTTSSAQLLVTASSSSNFSIFTGNASVVFTDAVGNTTASITPSSVSSVYSSGVQSLGFGSNVTVPAFSSQAFGNNLSTAFYASIVMGYGNTLPGSLTTDELTTWQPEDPLFVIGNGGTPDPLTIYKNGDAVITGSLIINGDVIVNGANVTISGNSSLGASGNVTVKMSSAKGEIPQLGD